MHREILPQKFINIKYVQKNIALYTFTRSYSTAKILEGGFWRLAAHRKAKLQPLDG